MKYAMISDGIVIDIIESNETPFYPDTFDGCNVIAVPISINDSVCLGMKYIDGSFSGEYIPENMTPTLIDVLEIIFSEILLNQQEILINQYNNEEVLASILLNQQESDINV